MIGEPGIDAIPVSLVSTNNPPEKMMNVWASDREKLRYSAFLIKQIADYLQSDNETIDQFVTELFAIALRMNNLDSQCRSLQIPPNDIERIYKVL
jgi:hypothetical protein